MWKRIVFAVLIITLAVPRIGAAQAPGAVWRGFAEKVELGTELKVRLQDGKRFRATLVGVEENSLLIQPKTRVPVAVQSVPYADILSLERRRDDGIGAAKAAAIGVGSGAGAFFAMLMILAAVFAD
jgi:hypothetical protein